MHAATTSPNTTYSAARTRNAVLDALADEDVPFDRLVQALHPARSKDGNPVFQILFASVPSVGNSASFGGVDLGGGIYVGGGTLTLTNSTISGNEAYGATGIGGGLYIAGGSVCMDRTTFLAIAGNSASTSSPDIFGLFTIC